MAITLNLWVVFARLNKYKIMITEDKKELEIALTTYIALKKNQSECTGFIDGFEAAVEYLRKGQTLHIDDVVSMYYFLIKKTRNYGLPKTSKKTKRQINGKCGILLIWKKTKGRMNYTSFLRIKKQ